MLACCVSRRLGFIHIPSLLLNMLAITLTILLVLTAVRQKVLMASLEDTGKGQEKKKSTRAFFWLVYKGKGSCKLD